VSPQPPFFRERFDQVAFVVEDLESACNYWREMYGVDGWSVWSDLANGQVDKTYYGQPEDLQFSCAYAFVGDVLIELCHHDGGRSVYKDWLNTRGPGLNHIGFRLRDGDDFEEAADVFLKRGARFAMGAVMPNTGRFAYFDTVGEIGVFTEIYYCVPMVLEIFERMKRGEAVELPRPT
jgi:catechol 2,3-dioxygenase-like lactoylglutathione lyase family enzyme